MTNRGILERALTLFGHDGEYWFKGDSPGAGYSDTSRALWLATPGRDYKEVYGLLQRCAGITTSLKVWNDAPERTWSDIKAAFERAILEAGQTERTEDTKESA